MEGIGGDWRLHVELVIHWSPQNVQRVPALVDTEPTTVLSVEIQTDSLDQPPIQTATAVRLLRLKL